MNDIAPLIAIETLSLILVLLGVGYSIRSELSRIADAVEKLEPNDE